LNAGANVNAEDDVALIEASEKGHIEIVKMLINRIQAKQIKNGNIGGKRRTRRAKKSKKSKKSKTKTRKTHRK